MERSGRENQPPPAKKADAEAMAVTDDAEKKREIKAECESETTVSIA